MATSTTPQPDAADPPENPPRAWTLTTRQAVPFSLIRRECLVEFPEWHQTIPVRLSREFTRQTPEIRLFSRRPIGQFGRQTTNSLYFTLLPGNHETETGSLETASSSGESA